MRKHSVNYSGIRKEGTRGKFRGKTFSAERAAAISFRAALDEDEVRVKSRSAEHRDVTRNNYTTTSSRAEPRRAAHYSRPERTK